ncbi:MAG: hypothetical protein V3T05_09890 [Myxococcota bacterium]
MRFSVVLAALLVVPSIAAAKKNEDPTSSAISNAGPSYAASPIGGANIIGVGLYLGRPAGITVKYWLGPDLAINGVVGSWLSPDQGGALAATVQYHVRDLLPGAKPLEIGVYFGGGAGVGWLSKRDHHFHDAPWPHWHTHPVNTLLLFIQPVVGANVMFRTIPIEVFLEMAPSFRLTPETIPQVWAVGGFGGRYYF